MIISPFYVNLPYYGKALRSLICADVPLRNCSLTHSAFSALDSGSTIYQLLHPTNILIIVVYVCSVMTMSTTTARSVSSVCASHATPSYCRADTSACATAVRTICATRLTTVRYVAPSSMHCCKCVPCVTRSSPVAVWSAAVSVWLLPRGPTDRQ